MRLNAGAAVIAATMMAVTPASAAMSADDIAAAIAASFGVSVLRVVAADDDGRAVYRVTVMSPGGDRNDAFQVTTIAVDAETGALVSQFRHLASGYRLSGAPTYDGDISRADAPERGVVWR